MGTGRLPAVIIPVHNAADELARCLESVHSTVPAGSEVIVIDDASTDGAVTGLLESWRTRAAPGWRFETNPRNLGFVATANRGMRLATGDVVLLNSDTECINNAVVRGMETGRDRHVAGVGHRDPVIDPPVRKGAALVEQTGVDALAVSIGTAHGVYKSLPQLNIERLKELTSGAS